MDSHLGTAYLKKTNSSSSSHQLPIASYLGGSLVWKGYLRANYLLHISSHKGFLILSFGKTTFYPLPQIVAILLHVPVEDARFFQMTFLKKKICLTVGLLHTFLKLCPDNARSYQSNSAFLAKTSCYLVPPERIKMPGNNPNILPQEKKIEVLGNPDTRFLLLL